MPGPQNDDARTPHSPDTAGVPELEPIAPPVPPPPVAPREDEAEIDDAADATDPGDGAGPTPLSWEALMATPAEAATQESEPLASTATPQEAEPPTRLVSTHPETPGEDPETGPDDDADHTAATPLSPVPAQTPGAAYAVTEEPGPDGQQAATRRRNTLIAIIGGAVAAAVVIALLIFFLWPKAQDNQPAPTDPTSSGTAAAGDAPADVVTKLGTALKAGDAKAALALLDVTSVTANGDAGHPLLQEGIYEAAKDRPTALVVDPDSKAVPSEQAKTAMVTATATQGGKQIPLTLNLTRAAPGEPWKISIASLPSIEVADAGGSTLKVNGKDVKLPGAADDYTEQRLFVLPGSYSLERKDDKYTEYPKAKTLSADVAAISSASTGDQRRVGTVSFKGKHNKAFKTEATKVINDWLSTCAASTDMVPPKCPFSAPTTYQGAAVTGASWDVTVQPKLTFSNDGTSETTVDGTGGTAKVTGTAKVDGEDTAVRGTVTSFGFKGDLVVKGNKITFSYRG